MIRIYKHYEGEPGLHVLQDIERESWVMLIDPTQEELYQISESYRIDIDDLKAALDPEERSRLENEEDYTMILVNIPVVEDDNGKRWYETIPLGIYITKKIVFTVCLEETNILGQFVDGLVPEFYTYMKTRFVYQILYNNAVLFLHYLRIIDQRANQIEDVLLETSRNKDLIQLYDLEKCLVYFTTSLKSNEVVLEKLRKHIGLRHYEEDQELLEDVIIENKQAMEMTYIYHNILRSTMSLFGSIIDNNLNQSMKFLAAVTIIVELPTMISGLYGMNVKLSSMPFAQSSYGFAVIAAFSVVVCLLAVCILKKKNLL
ncbi:MAG TPA: magnesium transporter CorA family protein [Candidatus Anaerostipes avistercoris]|uniref:Magnesium transporter CorA family protein n=1 Tax=Candidatus Anaerostipes avistercoris TaxID=2838462 RepID=A0A9D2PGJ1_9FIRM|nr:magnesium transporter CorA family protein [Candidatus Anaerostipes avistercoris]